MKKFKLIMILCCILSLGISSCQNVATQTAPIAEDDLKTLVAGTLTAVAFDVGQTQTMSVPPTETSTATITVPPPTAAPTETPTREVVTITLSGNTNCRKGASTYFPVITTFSAGSVVQVLAINPAGDYFYVRAPDSETDGCWIWKEFTTVAGNVDSLLVYTPMPTPLPTSTSTPLPRAVYTVKFAGLTTCGSGYAANFSITNTGNLSLQSIRIRNYLEGVTDPYVHKSDSFTQWSAGAKYAVVAEIAKGKTMIVSTCDPGGFPGDPTGKDISAEITICPANDLKGACTTTKLDYTPH
jgi:hypothetical protein